MIPVFPVKTIVLLPLAMVMGNALISIWITIVRAFLVLMVPGVRIIFVPQLQTR